MHFCFIVRDPWDGLGLIDHAVKRYYRNVETLDRGIYLNRHRK